MDEKLKYRLVGAAVVLALAVFFLPMILDSEKYRSQIQSQIPAIPSANESQKADISNVVEATTTFAATGPVEKGPLVINLDEEEADKPIIAIKDEAEKTPATAKGSNDDNTVATEQVKPQSLKEPVSEEKKPVKNTESQTQTVVEVKEQPKAKPVADEPVKTEPKPSNESELAFSDSAWLIQIGSFSNKDNATRLVEQLRNEGYRAYQRVGESYARVYVGPYPVKGEAESRTAALEKIIGSKVKIIEFDPKQH